MGIQGGKAQAPLGGRPLVCYPLEVLAAVFEQVAVACKPQTVLPELGDKIERWDEGEREQHPLAGITSALEQSAGLAVLVCAADMPFITQQACRALLEARDTEHQAVCALAGGLLQPVFCLYMAGALPGLRRGKLTAPLTETVRSLNPKTVCVDPRVVRSIDTQQELAQADQQLYSNR